MSSHDLQMIFKCYTLISINSDPIIVLHMTLKWSSKSVIPWNLYPPVFIKIQQWFSNLPSKIHQMSTLPTNFIQYYSIYSIIIILIWPWNDLQKMSSNKNLQIPKYNSSSYKLKLTLLGFLSILYFMISVISVDSVFSAFCLLQLPYLQGLVGGSSRAL